MSADGASQQIVGPVGILGMGGGSRDRWAWGAKLLAPKSQVGGSWLQYIRLPFLQLVVFFPVALPYRYVFLDVDRHTHHIYAIRITANISQSRLIVAIPTNIRCSESHRASSAPRL